MSRNLKPFQEYFFVASGSNQALKKTGSYQGTGATVNLASGQLGIICAEVGLAHLGYGEFLTSTNNPAASAANTAANCPTIKIVQGTPAATDNSGAFGWPSQDEGWVESCPIRGDEVVSASGRLYQIAQYSTRILSTTADPVDSTEYEIKVHMNSKSKGRTHRGRDVSSAIMPTGTMTATVKKDWMLQNLLYKLNLKSKKVLGNDHFVGFAINKGGSANGTPIGAVALNDVIPFMVHDGTTYNIVADAALLQTLYTWINGTAGAAAGILATSTIEPINLSTAGSKVAAVGTITITDFSALGTDTVTLNGSAKVEGTDWAAGASNTAAATALAAELDTISGVTVTSDGAVVSIVASTAGAAGNAIALAYTDGGTAGLTISGATLTGGDDTNVDAVAIMGLSHSLPANYDGLGSVMVNVGKTEFGKGFQDDATLTYSTIAGDQENLGSGRLMAIKYDDRAFAQSGLTALNGPADTILQAPKYVDVTKSYTVMTIDGVTEVKNMKQNYRVYILAQGTDDSASTTANSGITVSTSDSNAKTDLNAILSPWLASITGIKFLGAATSSAICP